jgi:hypothetical protein
MPGLMSGNGKRGGALCVRARAHPRLYKVPRRFGSGGSVPGNPSDNVWATVAMPCHSQTLTGRLSQLHREARRIGA